MGKPLPTPTKIESDQMDSKPIADAGHNSGHNSEDFGHESHPPTPRRTPSWPAPDGYRDETSTRPFDAGLITDSLMANARHRGGTLCLKVRSIGEAITA
jgi:hypothetical protein